MLVWCKKKLVIFPTAIRLTLLLAALFTSAGAELLPIRNYTSADGLIYESVRQIYQDSRGALWFATPVGLSRFDGYKFTNYAMENGLVSPFINDIVEDDKGVFWIGTLDSKVYRFDPRIINSEGNAEKSSPAKFVLHQVEPGEGRIILKLFKTGSGEVFIGTESGLFLLDNEESEPKFSRVELKGIPQNSQSIASFAEDADGNLWIGHELGLSRRLPDGRFVNYEVQPNGKTDWVRSISVDRQNRLWLITDRRSLLVFNPEPFGSIDGGDNPVRKIPLKTEGDFRDRLSAGFAYLFKPEESLADTNFSGVLCSRSEEKVWLATRGKGLVEFDGNNFRLYRKQNGLSDDRINTLFEDTFGNLWIGSAWGVMKLSRKGFVTFNSADRLAEDSTNYLFEDQAGVLFALNPQWKINRFDGHRFSSVKPNLPPEAGDWRYHQTLLDRRGDWWLGTQKGLYRFTGIKDFQQLAETPPADVFGKRNEFPSEDIGALFEDSRGDVWIGFWQDASGALSRWERETGKFYHYGKEDGIPAGCVPTYFREDAARNLFIGCRHDYILIFQQGRFKYFSANDTDKNGTIHDILVDNKGRLWVGFGIPGLKRIDNPLSSALQIKSYTPAEGASSYHIQYLAEDNYGKIYFVTSSGADRLDPETDEIKHFTLADGLAAAGTGRAIRRRDGTLWFATSKGISKFTPKADEKLPPPPIYISGIRVAGKTVPISALGETEISGLTLESDQRQMNIDFYGLNLASGEAQRYQYKLEGADADWSQPNEQRTVNFNLSPGKYRFLVRALNPDGSYSLNPASVSFRVLSPVWQRWWFIATFGLIVGVAIYAAYRYRVRRLLELERIRTRIATDLHDDIGSSLSQIAILSEVARQKSGVNGAAEPLDLIADTSREMVDSMSDIVWAINPAKDRLGDLIQRMRRFAEDVLDAKDIGYRFNAPEKNQDIAIGADIRREVYLIFKECVNNLIKHSGCSRADFEVLVKGDCLEIGIRDDGRGFDIDAQSRQEYSGFGGNGLINMRRRATALGGTLEIESALGKGTLIRLKVPIGKSSFFKKAITTRLGGDGG